MVIKEPGSEPVKKAVIELIAENQAEGGDYTAITGADGTFRIEGIVPGRYRLFAERTGFLETDKRRAHSEGRVLTLAAGQELKDLQIHLQPAAVVRGRVTDEDGDPMANAQVAVLRRTFVSGRSRWEQAGSERTNDLGEYRIAGLTAGNYYVSVSPPPDFKSLIEAANTATTVEPRTSSPEKPAATATTYQTTYYPGTADPSQATPIELHAGDEFPVDFSLTPSPSLSIRGSVVNLPLHSSAVIMLQSRDFSLVLNGAEMHPDGSFVIRDVAPGAYTIMATVDGASVPMMARQSLQVVANNIEGLRLAPQPGAWIRGRLRLEDKRNAGRFDFSEIFLALRSADGDDEALSAFSTGDAFSHLAHVAPDGSFEWKSVPPGNYYIQLAGDGHGNGNLFLKSVVAGNHDLDDSGIAVNGGTIVLDLIASVDGGVVEGVVIDRKGEPLANAVIVAAPEARSRGRADRFHRTVSDQSGRFTLHGLPPGEYTLFAWESMDGEAYYNADFLKVYEGQGTALRISGSGKTVQLLAIPDAEETN
jgi:protocatechuate 3,4-dioxygenase beta subunit